MVAMVYHVWGRCSLLRSPRIPGIPGEVIVQLSCCDGAVAACAGNAAFLALLDAGVAMKATAMCVALAETW